MSSLSSTNGVNTAYEVNTANIQVSPGSTQVSTASTQVSTANLSDAIVYAFLANQPIGSQVVHEDLEQIHEDDLEEMDLKWQLALLSMRTRKFFQKTGRKITINGSDTARYDKSKNQDSSKRTINVEDTSSKAMLAIDGAGFDWSYIADDEVPTNMALVDFLDSEFNKSEFNLATYKRGLASVEEQLIFYKKNKVLFYEQIVVLKRDISYKDSEISELKSELEKLKKEKESNQLKIENFDNASKNLDKLVGSQIPDKSRKGLGFARYNAVPPPHIGLFAPPTLDLSNSGLEEFQQPEFEGYGPKISKSVSKNVSNEVRKTPDAPLVEELVLDVDKFENKTVFPTKIEFVKQQEKADRKPVKYAKMYRLQGPMGNQRNWNNQKSQQLGSDFVMYNKACFVCGSFDHLQTNCNYHQMERVVSGSNYTRVNYNYSTQKAHPSAQRNMVPRAVLMKNSPRPLNTIRHVNTAHPKTTVYSARPMSRFSKLAQSTKKSPCQIKTTLTSKFFYQKVNTAKGKLYTARPKAVNTARPNTTVVNAIRANQGHPQQEDQGYVDSGCSRHMTGNMSYLSDFKEFDGGYVTFGGGAKGGRITGKGTLKTGKLDFEDVYFVKELQFNLFSVSQMCDKKNSVLFTDTGCFVLSPDFKLTDESQVLLKVPRKNNMYSVDMKNIVPKESLTCLVAKATLDESMLWHRRLGHINFKNINKLVKDNLARGLPSKRFENDQTCVACLKGKQHKASCKSKIQNSISQPLFMLHMDLFGLTFVSSLMNKKYCLVVTDDYSRFTWVFFLASKDETSDILKSFITQIENLVDKKVKIIRCDNGTEFKNRVMSEFCEKKGIKREFSLPTTFWAKAVNTACYVHNRVLVVKPHNKIPYELFRGRTPALSFMRPFGCHVTILNTLDHLGKFDGKSDDGFFVGYFLNSVGPKWLFDIDVLTESMNYVPVLHEQTLMILQKDDDSEIDNQERPEKSAQDVNTAGASIKIASTNDNTGSLNINTEVNMSNITTTYPVSSTPNTRIHKDHSLAQMIGDIQSSEEPKKVIQALNDPSWIEAMQEELLQFKLQQVWTLVDLPYGKRAIRGIVIRNKARLVAQGYTQEEGIDYNEFFAPVAKIEAIRLFLAYASFKGFVVYQMDVKSAFLYGKIEEEVYVCQPLGFENPEFPDKVYKVEKALYGLHQASRAWYETLSTYLLDNGFQRGQINKTLFFRPQNVGFGDLPNLKVHQLLSRDIIMSMHEADPRSSTTKRSKLIHKKFQMSSIGELTFFLGLQMKQKNDGIFISQDKYVEEIFKKFDFSTVKTVSTPMETSKPLLKHAEAENVDAHLYRSMIGSLMYLTTSRPDIMFAFCACTRFQVTHKVSHLHVVKWIFRYLKGQPKLGLWYPRDSPFDLEAFSDSDYAGASLDRKSTTGVVAKSTTEAEYVAAANCCGRVLWIQNQMLDYGFNFMNTKIYIDNESTICIVKNPVFHSKTNHIEIRHHFIRDSYEKKLIQVIKIHTDHNVADLLTKAFDVSRFNFLIASIGLLNL
ncbi:retrovirus-related pol polyprotein from transposon TNT 1-94 [Tanacetum coccineum]|uniref:Retrovirus-related pol polyprotein from transposon TNT 1-94 n=1 Tax=Tanacetum coccineum TaxID=301880 RepID=A0ABQ5E1R6_9ASTR